MAELIVGEPDCSINDVLITITNCGDSFPSLWRQWKLFATNLQLTAGQRDTIEIHSNSQLSPGYWIIEQVVIQWRGKFVRDATLSKLLAALPQNLNDIAVALRERFNVSRDEVDFQASRQSSVAANLPLPTRSSPEDGNCLGRGNTRPHHDPTLWDVKNANLIPVDAVRPQQPMNFQNDEYRLPADSKKGKALIINIMQFLDKNKNRRGAIYDTKHMKKLWKQLGYDVENHDDYIEDFTESRVSSILERFKQKCIHDEAKSFVVFFGSHGECSKLEMVDGKLINIYDKIIYEMAKCPEGNSKWAEIPKIFIIQACRDSTDSAAKPIENTIVCYSSLPNYPSYRNENSGTDYVRTLTSVMMGEAHRLDFVKILKKIEDELWNMKEQQMSAHEILGGFKTLYFNLKPIDT